MIKKSTSPQPVVFVETHDKPSRHPLRLIGKQEVLHRVPVTFATLWHWMRQEPPKFPRSRVLGGKTAWVEAEVEAWIKAQPESVFKKMTEEVA